MSKDLPATIDDDDEDDRQCRYMHPEGHPKAGTQCEAFHTKDSSFCYPHRDGAKALNKARSEHAAKTRDLKNRLDSKHYQIRRIEDIQDLTADVINGILSGAIKREKAAPLGVFIPLAYKMAKEQQGRGVNTESFATLTDAGHIELQLSDEEMDKYLAGDDTIKIEILENAKETGKIKVQKSGKVDVDVSKVDPDKVRIAAGEISKISQKTDLPISTEQARGIFGRTLADKGEGKLPKVEPPQPEPEPEHGPHKFKGKYEPDPEHPERAKLWFTCIYCELRQPNVNKEICEKSPKPQ